VTDAVAEQIESPEAEPDEQPVIVAAVELPQMAAFLSQTESATRSGSWKPGAVVVAVALIVGVVAVPWGMYARRKTAQLASEAQTRPATTSEPAALPAETNQTPNEPVASESAVASPAAAADLAARRWREGRARERARALETSSVLAPPQSTTAAVNPRAQATPVSGSRKVTVQVTYDENGRVTQASGGDATALRIARQKRFPAGKAGAATITIPIN